MRSNWMRAAGVLLLVSSSFPSIAPRFPPLHEQMTFMSPFTVKNSSIRIIGSKILPPSKLENGSMSKTPMRMHYSIRSPCVPRSTGKSPR